MVEFAGPTYNEHQDRTKREKNVALRTITPNSRNILSGLTSFQIRRFVCPFYRDSLTNIQVRQAADTVDRIFFIPKEAFENSPTTTEHQITGIDKENANVVEVENYLGLRKKKGPRKNLKSKAVKKTKCGLVSESSSAHSKSKSKFQRTLERICTPTESSLRRARKQHGEGETKEESCVKIFRTGDSGDTLPAKN